MSESVAVMNAISKTNSEERQERVASIAIDIFFKLWWQICLDVGTYRDFESFRG